MTALAVGRFFSEFRRHDMIFTSTAAFSRNKVRWNKCVGRGPPLVPTCTMVTCLAGKTNAAPLMSSLYFSLSSCRLADPQDVSSVWSTVGMDATAAAAAADAAADAAASAGNKPTSFRRR